MNDYIIKVTAEEERAYEEMINFFAEDWLTRFCGNDAV